MCDISPSTPAQNAEALDNFYKQTGIGDPNDTPNVLPVHGTGIPLAGDLLTCQHIRSLQESRAEESTPWRRAQGVFFVMGLFHLKMACADAIWRVLIHPKGARDDTNSLMAHVGQIRSKETGKIEKDPGFRRMHEVIQHVGIASRLDMWRLEAVAWRSTEQYPMCNLGQFAETRPQWKDLCKMANNMALKYVANDSHFEKYTSGDPASQRDTEYENALLRQQYFLLYEEISYAMNSGDIGRVEVCMIPWAMIFTACGKHKYATEMRQYLENVHFIFPPALRYVFRYICYCY